MATAIDISAPDNQLSRAGLKLKLLTQAWSRQARGERYSEALLGFLGSKQNEHTRRSYAFALLEFWDWYWAERKIYPTPDKVRRAEAHAYAQWLTKRKLGLDELRLSQDPERRMDLAIYRDVKQAPGVRCSALRRKLLLAGFGVNVTFSTAGRSETLVCLEVEQGDLRGDAAVAFVDQYGRPPPNGLDLHLACLTERGVLRRTPTVEQIRSESVSVNEDDPSRAQLDYRVDPDLFQYFTNPHTQAQGAERASTVSSRLSVLCSFWEQLRSATGENVGDTESLLAHNIWNEPRRRASRISRTRKQLSREIKTPDMELFVQVLATTFRRSHGEQAAAAAAAAASGANVSTSASGVGTLMALRDRAIMLFMMMTGVRAEELQSIRRGQLRGTPVLLTIVGKGDKTRTFVVPPAAMAAVVEFQAELSERAARCKPGSLTDLLTDADAPLFPPLKLWGRNGTELQRAEELSGLSTSGLARMLHRRATFAGHDKDSAEYAKMHPHGLRHLAALSARDRGVDISTIQATMGHSSLAYTGHYLEVRDPRHRSLMPAARGSVREPEPVAPAHEPSRTIDVAVAPSEPAAAEPPVVEIHLETPTEPLEVKSAAEVTEGGLVGIGQAPLEPTAEVLLQSAQEAAAADAPALVRETYSSNWGEGKGRARTWLQRGSTGLLSHAYVGKRTGLPWWEGAGGKMHSESFGYTPNPDFPAMPIMSPSQLLGPLGEPLCSEQLCLELVALYDRWMADEKFGATAAAALSQWVRTASLVTIEADEVLRKRHGGWLPTDAPTGETKLAAGARPAAVRTHLDGAILSWFEQTAWQYRETGEGRVATGAPFDMPAWYRSTDPLGDLSERDRGELLDWLQVWVGRPPTDRAARFDGLSRKELGKFLSLLCQYEMVAGDDEIEPELKELSSAALETELQRLVSKLTAGKVSDFSYATERKARKSRAVSAEIAKRVQERGGTESKQLSVKASEHSKYLSPHFTALVKKLFGKEAGADPILQLFSLCTAGAPLGAEGDKYKGLFRVRQGNIRHTPEFAREFAAATGAHSECVARRLARHLYEEGKPDAWYRRKNWSERLDYLDAMAAYRIPCPQAQEQELVALLPESEVPAVLEQWERGGRMLQQAGEPEDGRSEAEAMMQEEQARDIVRPTRVPTGFRDTTPNRRAAALTRLAPARALLPNPILLYGLSAAILRARRR